MKLEEFIRAGLPASIRCGSFGPRSIHSLVGRADDSRRFHFRRHRRRSDDPSGAALFRCDPGSGNTRGLCDFMFRDPDRLQSEEYRIRQRALEILYKKGGNTEIMDVANQVIRVETSDPRTGSGEDK